MRTKLHVRLGAVAIALLLMAFAGSARAEIAYSETAALAAGDTLTVTASIATSAHAPTFFINCTSTDTVNYVVELDITGVGDWMNVAGDALSFALLPQDTPSETPYWFRLTPFRVGMNGAGAAGAGNIEMGIFGRKARLRLIAGDAAPSTDCLIAILQ